MTSKEEKHIFSEEEKYCVLVSITNLTKDTQSEKTGYLDDSVRQIYALYERITLLNHPEDSIKPLYTDTRGDLLSNRRGIKRLVEEYAERYIFPEDKARFIRAFDPGPATLRLRESGSISFSEVFRTSVRHGQYAWKEYTLLKIDDDNYFMLVRNVHGIVTDFIANSAADHLSRILRDHLRINPAKKRRTIRRFFIGAMLAIDSGWFAFRSDRPGR